MTGIHTLTSAARKIIDARFTDNEYGDRLKTMLSGINLLNRQLSWPCKNSIIRYAKSMKACRRATIGSWAPGIVALDDLVHTEPLTADIITPKAASLCKAALNDTSRADSRRLLNIRGNNDNRDRKFFRGQPFTRGQFGSNSSGRFPHARGRRQFRDGARWKFSNNRRGRGAAPAPHNP